MDLRQTPTSTCILTGQHRRVYTNLPFLEPMKLVLSWVWRTGMASTHWRRRRFDGLERLAVPNDSAGL